MSMWKQFATPAENDYDDMVARHKDGECIEDCPLCGEEDYQRDMYERIEDKRKAQECADAFKPLAENPLEPFYTMDKFTKLFRGKA